ncbi:acid protease [Xylariomycetidae sp. FL0641]|nr:acid protease [Xylariomycetidae sp. FL0641]
MHPVSTLARFSLWMTGIYALSVPSTEGPGLSTRAMSSQKRLGFVTFKMQKLPTTIKSATPKSHLVAPSRKQRDATVDARDNEYAVVQAEEPTASNAAGILQDGTDYAYFSTVKLGSSGKELYMLLDTGASTTWVMGSECQSVGCDKHNSFGPDDSDTYKDTGNKFSVEYGTGSVDGDTVSDTMSLADLAVTLSFGVANVTSDEFADFPFDGIMGLSMSSDNFLAAVQDAGLLDANLFGVSLSRNADGVNDGEIAFGAPDPAKYSGDISYTPISSGNTWTIALDDVSAGGNSAGISGKLAYIDTGTSFIFGPPDDVKKVYDNIPGSSSGDGSVYTVPCDTDATVALTFSGQSWEISSKDFLSGPESDGSCTGNIYGMEYIPNGWLVGDTFLKNVYSVFDIDQRQIGKLANTTAVVPFVR